MELFHLRHPSRVSLPLRKGSFVAQLVMVQPDSLGLQGKKSKNTSSVQKKAKHIIDAVEIQKKQPVLKKTGSTSLTKQKRIPKADSPPVKKKAVSPPVKRKSASPPASPPVKKKKESLKVHKETTPSQPSSPSCKKLLDIASLGPPTLTKQDHGNGDCSPVQKPDQIRAYSPPVLKKVKQTKSTAEPRKPSEPCKTSFTSLKNQSHLDKVATKPMQKKHLAKQANDNRAARTLKQLGTSKNASPSLQREKDGHGMELSSPSKLASEGKGKGPKGAASIVKRPSLAVVSSPSFQKPLDKEKITSVPHMKQVDGDTIRSSSLKKAFGMAKTVAAPLQKQPIMSQHATGPVKRHADFDDAACSLFQRQLDEAKVASPPIRKKAHRAVSDAKKQSDSNKQIEHTQDKTKGASTPAWEKGQQAKATSPPLKGLSSPFQKLPDQTKTKASSPNRQKKTDWGKLDSLPFKKQPGSTVSLPPGFRNPT